MRGPHIKIAVQRTLLLLTIVAVLLALSCTPGRTFWFSSSETDEFFHGDMGYWFGSVFDVVSVRMPDRDKLSGQFCRIVDIPVFNSTKRYEVNYFPKCEQPIPSAPPSFSAFSAEPEAFAVLSSKKSRLKMEVWITFNAPDGEDGIAKTGKGIALASDGREYIVSFY